MKTSLVSVFLIAALLVGALIVYLSARAYNKRLDRIANGEEHDTHSSVPEPRAAMGVIYKTILMGIAAVSLIAISVLQGKVNALQQRVDRLNSQQNDLMQELRGFHNDFLTRDSLVSGSSYDVLDHDAAARTAKIHYDVALKEYTADTKVALCLNDREIPLEPNGYGVYAADFEADLFDWFEYSTLKITDGETTKSEAAEVYGEFFREVLPMPELSCHFDTTEPSSSLKVEGGYTIYSGNVREIESASVTYMTGGKDVKTLDVTEKVMNGEEITLEKGLPLEKDLTFRIEFKTKSGLRIVQTTVMVYNVSAEDDPDPTEKDNLQIYDLNGELLWDQATEYK